MASKRRPIHPSTNPPSRANFRPAAPESVRSECRGTRPTTEPASVKEILVLMILHVCKKSLFFDTNIKVGLYLGTLFLVSLIGDFLPMPKSYFSRSSNIFNQYFVKFAWGWNLLVLIPFVTLTALTYCCGNIRKVVREHFTRIIIATAFWFIWTKLFNVIETSYGKCNLKTEISMTKQGCLKGNGFWHGFDISGHSFILIYGSLVLIEEARVMVGWESIKEYIRNEEYNRVVKDSKPSTNPLRNLDQRDLIGVKVFYEKFTPYIRGLFVVMTLFQILWDVMLITTILYYHIMIEKFIGGALAIITWFFTYRAWYTIPNLLPRSPGDGSFKYVKVKPITPPPLSRKASINLASNGKQIPRFMGMPLYNQRPPTDSENPPTNLPEDFRTPNSANR